MKVHRLSLGASVVAVVVVTIAVGAQNPAPISPQFSLTYAAATPECTPTPVPAVPPTPIPIIGPVRMEQSLEVVERQCRSHRWVDVDTGTHWVWVYPGQQVTSNQVQWVANEPGQRWRLTAAAAWDQQAGGWSYSAARPGVVDTEVPGGTVVLGRPGPEGVMRGTKAGALAQLDAEVRAWWLAEMNRQ